MSKLDRSWELFGRAIQVIRENKGLLLFPILTTCSTLVLLLCFLIPIAYWSAGSQIWRDLNGPGRWDTILNLWQSWGSHRPVGHATAPAHANGAGYALFALVYLVSMFQATFFNVAFYSQILNALNGRPVSVSAGLRVALARWKAILAWSLFTGAVGIVIRTLEERMSFVGRLILGYVGMAWSVATVFVVPVIVREQDGANPVQLVKVSAGALRRTWGESLIGYLGLQVGAGILFMFSLLFLGLGIYLSYALLSLWLAGIIGGLWLACVFAFAYACTVADLVYRGALFVYATEGVVPGPFDQAQMDMAWKVKAGRKPLSQ